MDDVTHRAFAELRSLCQRPATDETWWAIIESLKRWPDEQLLVDLAMPYVSDHLSHWPDELRRGDHQAIEELKQHETPIYMPVLKRLGKVEEFVNESPGIAGAEHLSGDKLRWLTQSSAMRNIRSLNVRNHWLHNEDILSIAKSEHLQQLRWLDIGGTQHFTTEGLIDFAQQSTLEHLEHLEVWRLPVDDVVVREMCLNESMRAISYLELGDTRITAKALTYLANSPIITDLWCLCLWENSLDLDAISAIVDAPKFSKLRELELDMTEMDEHMVLLLAQRETLSGLKKLTLGNNDDLHDAGAIAVAASPYLTQLTDLELLSCWMSDEGVEALCGSENMRHMEDLSIQDNMLTPRSGHMVAQCEYFGELKELYIWDTNQDAESLAAILDSPHLVSLEELYAGGHDLKYKGIKRMLEGRNIPNITHLSIDRTELGPNSVRALAKAPFEQLKYLNIGNNIIEDKGLMHLIKSPHLDQLTHLKIERCGLTDQGFKQLTESGKLSNLRELHISYNTLTDASLELIGHHESFSNLEFLYCYSNNQTTKGYKHLVDSPHLGMEVRAFYKPFLD